ncbi:bifunctional diguanylate cyclase/phosphodiesterase [Undibacterium sp. Rencai35W]|uniref:bifunctional diguanylate cyclase/phosphodiesterase n=1 Tax=Undibacterium sp. Rencai35W TaxID=3413046 RepID=UPI003BF4377D
MNSQVTARFLKVKAVPAALLTAVICISVTTGLCWLSLQVSKENLKRRLQETVYQHHASLQNELEHEESRLESFVSLYYISPNFNRYAFHSFAKVENQPWLVAKLFSKRVRPDEFNRFEQAVKIDTSVDTQGYPDFSITDKVAHQDALVALYMEPRQELRDALGLNLEKWFPSGSKRMRESAQPLSFMLNNQHPILKGNNIVISIPVYNTSLPLTNQAQRKTAFQGAFSTVISIDKLIHHLFDSANLKMNSVTLSGTGIDDEKIQITLPSGTRTDTTNKPYIEQFNFQLPLSVPGKKWSVNYEIQTYDGLAETNILWLITLIGTLFTTFATGFIYLTVRTGKIAHRLAYDMTSALQISEESLLETQRLAKMGSFQLSPSHQLSAQTGNLHDLFYLDPEIRIDYLLQLLLHMDAEDALKFTQVISTALTTVLHTHQVVRIESETPGWLNLIVDSSETPTGFTLRVIAMDVTDKYQSEQKIKQLAYQDALTGLANRTSLRHATERALRHSHIYHSKLAVFFLDLDRFKFINDSVGHDIGDQVLIEIAHRLKNSVKEVDFVARLGGDEFVILVEHLPKDNDVNAIADRILALICAPMNIGKHTYYLTTSIGIAIASDGAPDVDELMKQADMAMYQSKEKGKNKYTIFSIDIAQALEQRTNLELEMRVAMKEKRFLPYFQPQFDVRTHQMIGVETLLRWRHEKRGMIAAKDFIAVAEESGLIIDIGNQILVEVCQLIPTWNLPEKFVVGVNVSSLQFFQAGFVDFVIKSITDAGIPPSRIEIEVTETMIMQDINIAKICLEQLHAFGVGVSIDDFGTGYASLTYLREFPVQRIKIDQRFVKGHTKNHKDMAIVKAISTLGHDFGMEVIAEGVETELQLISLENIGCDLYQGWLRSTALPAQAIQSLLPPIEPDRPTNHNDSNAAPALSVAIG